MQEEELAFVADPQQGDATRLQIISELQQTTEKTDQMEQTAEGVREANTFVDQAVQTIAWLLQQMEWFWQRSSGEEREKVAAWLQEAAELQQKLERGFQAMAQEGDARLQENTELQQALQAKALAEEACFRERAELQQELQQLQQALHAKALEEEAWLQEKAKLQHELRVLQVKALEVAACVEERAELQRELQQALQRNAVQKQDYEMRIAGYERRALKSSRLLVLMKERQQQLDELSLSNTATQILRIASELDDMRWSTCDLFDQMLGSQEGMRRVAKLARAVGDDDPLSFSMFADTVVTTRNGLLHRGNRRTLDQDVAGVIKALNDNPALEEKFWREAKTVRAYPAILESHPDRFKPV